MIANIVRIFLLSAPLFVAASCSKTDDQPYAVSGPSYCRDFDLEGTRLKAEKNDLTSVRSIRDFYLDCTIKGNKSEVMRWGKIAADIGNQTDKELYSSLEKTYN